MALLLFLVCAAISSAVITSGSVVSGRLSEMTEMDQRYYSVSSAAELVRDVICKEPVVFNQTLHTVEVSTEEKTTRDITVTTKIGSAEPNATGHMLDYASTRLTFGKKWSGTAHDEEDETGATDDDSDTETRTDYEKIEDIWDAYLAEDASEGAAKPQWKFSVEPQGTKDKGILKVNATATIDGDELIFVFQNDGPGEKLLLTMTCTPDAPVIKNEKLVSTNTTVDTETVGTGAEAHVKVTTTTTETMTHDVWVNWTKENCVITR